METFVELVCPGCEKYWEASPSELPDADAEFDCPACDERRTLAEFTRSSRDLEIVRDSVQ